MNAFMNSFFGSISPIQRQPRITHHAANHNIPISNLLNRDQNFKRERKRYITLRARMSMEEEEEVVMDTVVSREERLGGATKNSGRGQGWTGRTHGATAEFGSEITKGGEREERREPARRGRSIRLASPAEPLSVDPAVGCRHGHAAAAAHAAAAVAALARLPTAELLYLSSFSFSGGAR